MKGLEWGLGGAGTGSDFPPEKLPLAPTWEGDTGQGGSKESLGTCLGGDGIVCFVKMLTVWGAQEDHLVSAPGRGQGPRWRPLGRRSTRTVLGAAGFVDAQPSSPFRRGPGGGCGPRAVRRRQRGGGHCHPQLWGWGGWKTKAAHRALPGCGEAQGEGALRDPGARQIHLLPRAAGSSGQ